MSLAKRLRKFWNQPTIGKAATERVATGLPWPWNEADPEKFLDKLLGGRPVDGLDVLDFGAGIGRLSKPLAARGARVKAVDVSPEMLRHGAGYCSGLSVEWHLSEGRDCGGVPAASCDLAISALCFQHMPTRKLVRDCLAAIGETLRPGGLALVQFSKEGPVRPLGQVGFVGVRTPEPSLPSLAEKCGLSFQGSRGWGSKWFIGDFEKAASDGD